MVKVSSDGSEGVPLSSQIVFSSKPAMLQVPLQVAGGSTTSKEDWQVASSTSVMVIFSVPSAIS